ncbi:uncharacterized protein V1516DRAFT_620447, partial [Lipomyces oligophaga]|uniref:uncharacterized protein n=1 Tax=Lipomyces oligophaga TaxID=45792 RepID=UPI0034CDD784
NGLLKYIDTSSQHIESSHHEAKPMQVISAIQPGLKDYWAQAEVASESKIFVEIGLGLYLEMSNYEARSWASSAKRAVESLISRARQVEKYMTELPEKIVS